GMVAFICYFFALFLHVEPAQVPRLCAAIGVGVGCTLFVRVVVLPERPRLEIRRLARALRAGALEALAAARLPDERGDRVLRRRLDRLGATALMIEDWIDRHESDRLISVTGRALSATVFEAQLATEQLAVTLWTVQAQTVGSPWLAQAMASLQTALEDDPSAEALRQAWRSSSRAAHAADMSRADGVATMVAHRAVQAHIGIHRVTTRGGWVWSASFQNQGPRVPTPG